jgi:hypothetical protein
VNAPDVTSQPRRRGPRGRGAYLWLIKRVPDRYEPQLRDAATTVRHRRLRIRLFRERWIRRSRRSVRRSERAWMRRIRRMRQLARTASRSAARARRSLQLTTLQTQLRRQGAEHNENSISRHDQQVAAQLAWTPRGRIARVIFPATVRFPGDGELVVIDATGHPTAQIVACQDHFPQRFLVVTDAPSVGALRAAGIPYEYLPTASANHPAETFLERLLWLDYVYGIDRIERLDHYSANPPAKYPQQP